MTQVLRVEGQAQPNVFEAKRSEDFVNWLIVTCPREECGLPFMVRTNEFLKPRPSVIKEGVTIRGKPCPYCFFTARPPARKSIK